MWVSYVCTEDVQELKYTYREIQGGSPPQILDL